MNSDGWNESHTMYCINGYWYHVAEYAPDEYRALVMGLIASGRTPAEAIGNAARQHQPQPSEDLQD